MAITEYVSGHVCSDDRAFLRVQISYNEDSHHLVVQVSQLDPRPAPYYSAMIQWTGLWAGVGIGKRLPIILICPFCGTRICS